MAVPTVNGTGSVVCVSDANEQLTLAAAPPSGQSRWDLVVVRPRASDIGYGTQNDFTIEAVQGTPGPTPALPAVPPGTCPIAALLRPGGSTGIDLTQPTNALDMRPFHMNTDFQGTQSFRYWINDIEFNWDTFSYWDWLGLDSPFVLPPLTWDSNILVNAQAVMHARTTPVLARTGVAWRIGGGAWTSDWSLDYSYEEVDHRTVARNLAFAQPAHQSAEVQMGVGIEPGWGASRTHWYNWRVFVTRQRALPL